jgi:ADP-heptose:LPS heptosyltransferase
MRLIDFIGNLGFLSKPKGTDIKSILILQVGNFGDVIVTLPTIKGFKELFPNAKIGVLVKKNMMSALEYSKGYVDSVIGIEEDWMPQDGKVSFKPLFKFMKTDMI